MGKQKKQLASTLDYSEKLTLKKSVLAETKSYQRQVADMYHDDFNQSIMVDPEDTRIKNEVLRKIKFYKIKKNNLPDFIRKKKIEILTQRAEDEKTMLLNRSQETIDDENTKKTINKDPVNINTSSK